MRSPRFYIKSLALVEFGFAWKRTLRLAIPSNTFSVRAAIVSPITVPMIFGSLLLQQWYVAKLLQSLQELIDSTQTLLDSIKNRK